MTNPSSELIAAIVIASALPTEPFVSEWIHKCVPMLGICGAAIAFPDLHLAERQLIVAVGLNQGRYFPTFLFAQ